MYLFIEAQEQGLREPERASRSLLIINEGEHNAAIWDFARGLIDSKKHLNLRQLLLISDSRCIFVLRSKTTKTL
mgnify:CR=1 FL=1